MVCLEGKSMTPGREKEYFPFLPATPWSLSRTLEGLFGADMVPRLTSYIASRTTENKDTGVRCIAFGTEVP